MNKTYASLLLAMLSLCLPHSNVYAELKLPSGADRRPDLSLDPFERAREAMRKLPESDSQEEPEISPQKPVKDPEPEENQEEPEQEPESKSDSGDSAFSYEIALTLDAFSVTAGGVVEPNPNDIEQNSTGVFGTLDLSAELDTSALNFWDDGLFFIYTSVIFGTAPAVGDLNGVSGIYGGGSTMRIVEAWYEHSFPFSHSSVLFGLHDFNSEFYVAEYADLFLNGGFGMGQPIGTHGNVSTFPVPTLGLRFKSQLSEKAYLQMALYDGASSETAYDKIIEVKPDKTEGVFTAGEAGAIKNEPGDTEGYYKVALGFWYYRADQVGFPNSNIGEDNETYLLEDNPKPGTSGLYMLAETSIGKKLGLFFKHGRARSDYNRYDQYYSAGLNFTGAIPGRDEDILGVGVIHTRHSDAFLEANPDQFFKAETAYEITYSAIITNWLMIQPDFQYIQQPNMTPADEQANTAVIGIRAQAIF